MVRRPFFVPRSMSHYMIIYYIATQGAAKANANVVCSYMGKWQTTSESAKEGKYE